MDRNPIMKSLESFLVIGKLLGMLTFGIISTIALTTHDIEWVFRTFSAFLFYVACKELWDTLY